MTLAGFVVAGTAAGAAAQEPTPADRVQQGFAALDRSAEVLTDPAPVARNEQLGIPGMDMNSPGTLQELYSPPAPGAPLATFDRPPSYNEGDIIPREQPLQDWGVSPAEPPHPRGLPLDPNENVQPPDQAPPGWEQDKGVPMAPPTDLRDALNDLQDFGFQAAAVDYDPQFSSLDDYGFGYSDYGSPDFDATGEEGLDTGEYADETSFDGGFHDETGYDSTGFDASAGYDSPYGEADGYDDGYGDGGYDGGYDGSAYDSGYGDGGYDGGGYDGGGYDGGGYGDGGYDGSGYDGSGYDGSGYDSGYGDGGYDGGGYDGGGYDGGGYDSGGYI